MSHILCFVLKLSVGVMWTFVGLRVCWDTMRKCICENVASIISPVFEINIKRDSISYLFLIYY